MIEFALLVACLEHDLDHDLIRAIAKQESAGSPNAFYINQWDLEQFRNLSLDEAVMVAEKMVSEGYTVDVGLMGINSRNIERFGMSIREAFDPCTNINLGEQILFENLQTAASKGFADNDATKVALSLYNTGSTTRGFKNGYVNKVWGNYSATTAFEASESDITVAWEVISTLDEVTREKPTWLKGVNDE